MQDKQINWISEFDSDISIPPELHEAYQCDYMVQMQFKFVSQNLRFSMNKRSCILYEKTPYKIIQ